MPDADAMKHAELVGRAVRWLKGKKRCVLVLREFRSWSREHPDAIGWRGDGRSILIECKASRGDFLRDRKKACRRGADVIELGVASQRYYMTGPGLVAVEEVPAGWGLLIVEGRSVVEAKRAIGRAYMPGVQSEMAMLVNAARRIKHGWGVDQIAHVQPGRFDK